MTGVREAAHIMMSPRAKMSVSALQRPSAANIDEDFTLLSLPARYLASQAMDDIRRLDVLAQQPIRAVV